MRYLRQALQLHRQAEPAMVPANVLSAGRMAVRIRAAPTASRKPANGAVRISARPASNFHSEKPFCSRKVYGRVAIRISSCREDISPARRRTTRPVRSWMEESALRMSGTCFGHCEKCSARRPLQVHHRLPIRYFKNYSDAHDLPNLLALCIRCHAAKHRKLRAALPLLELIPFA